MTDRKMLWIGTSLIVIGVSGYLLSHLAREHDLICGTPIASNVGNLASLDKAPAGYYLVAEPSCPARYGWRRAP